MSCGWVGGVGGKCIMSVCYCVPRLDRGWYIEVWLVYRVWNEV